MFLSPISRITMTFIIDYYSCQGNVDQQFDIFVVKIHTTKLSKGNPKKHVASECDFSGVFEDLKKYKVLSQTLYNICCKLSASIMTLYTYAEPYRNE